jgi:hypothetical protein
MLATVLPCTDCGREVPHGTSPGTQQPMGYDDCVCCHQPLCPHHHLKQVADAFYVALCQACYDTQQAVKVESLDHHRFSMGIISTALSPTRASAATWR